MALTLVSGGLELLDDAMRIMARAFDPAFGEAWTAAQCRGVIAMPGSTLTLARGLDGELCGFTLTRTVCDETELMLLAVPIEKRRQGIGSALLVDGLSRARSRGVQRYFLEVRSDNAAIELYRSYGFQQVGVRPNYYRGNDGRSRDALTFRHLMKDFQRRSIDSAIASA